MLNQPLKIALVLLALTVGCSHLSKTDKALIATGVALEAVDYMQTSEIVSNPEYHELSPHLGPEPSQRDVDLFFAVGTASKFAIACLLPERWRRLWLGLWIGSSGATVFWNYQAGIRFKISY